MTYPVTIRDLYLWHMVIYKVREGCLHTSLGCALTTAARRLFGPPYRITFRPFLPAGAFIDTELRSCGTNPLQRRR